jgi:hypothetical protein
VGSEEERHFLGTFLDFTRSSFWKEHKNENVDEGVRRVT